MNLKYLKYSIAILVLMLMSACESGNNIDTSTNVFFLLDKSIDKTNKIIDIATTRLVDNMEETAQFKIQYKGLVVKAKEAANIGKEFSNYINEVRDHMIEQSGGYYTAENNDGNASLLGLPIGADNTSVPQRIFISGDYAGVESTRPSTFEVPVGPYLDKRIRELKNKYLALVAGIWEYPNADGTIGLKGTIFADPTRKEAALYQLEARMNLIGSSNYNGIENNGKSWAAYTFGELPVAAVYSLLRKYQNDAKTTEAAVVDFLAAQMGKLEW